MVLIAKPPRRAAQAPPPLRATRFNPCRKPLNESSVLDWRYAHYLLKKFVEEKELSDILFNLFEFIEVVPVNLDILKKGLRSSHKDFEDAVQILCASSITGINCIVTRNKKDFKTSEIAVLTPDEMCLKL